MERLRRIPIVGWVVIAILGASVLAPAAAVATTNLVGIIGANGKRAGVTYAGQLLATEASPASFRSYYYASVGSCTPIFTVPRTSGFIVRQVDIDTWQLNASGSGGAVAVLVGNCSLSGGRVALVNPGGLGLTVVPISPGFALRPGTTLYASNLDPVNNGFDVQVNGYAVPASDVPSGTGPAIAAQRGGGRT